MTFSDRKVRTLLNGRFACAWVNTKGDPNAGASFSHAPGTPAGTCIRGNGEHNIQLVTMTPEGKIFHVLSGYIAPEDLVEELQFALSTFDSLADRGRMKPADRVVAAHRDFLEALEKKPHGRPLRGRGRAAAGRAEFANFIVDAERRRAREDHRFVMRHPLLDVGSFRPSMLVGNGQTFFGSSAGGVPRETIGESNGSAKRILDRIEEFGKKARREIPGEDN